MAPLVGYDSSDDDSGNEVPQTETPAQVRDQADFIGIDQC